MKSNLYAVAMYLRRCLLYGIHLAGSLLGLLLCWRRGEHYRVSRIHIDLIFADKTPQQRKQLLRASLIESGKGMAEMIFYWLFPSDLYVSLIRNVHGEQHVKDAQAAGRSVILVSPHLGNWEIFNMHAGTLGSLTTYKPLKTAWLDRRICRCRERHGSKLIPLSTAGIRTLFQQLRHSGVVTVFPDQLPDGSGRVVVPYFGLPARTGTLVSRLLQKSNALVVCVFAERLPFAGGFNVHYFPVGDEVYSDNLEQSAAALNREMEQCIRRCPEQYLWEYKRFKYTVDADLYRRQLR